MTRLAFTGVALLLSTITSIVTRAPVPFKRQRAEYGSEANGRVKLYRLDRSPKRKQGILAGASGYCGYIITCRSPYALSRLYYAGWDGPHGIAERTPGIGFANIRKDGFISMHGPAGGGVLVTRPLLWPGGRLHLNASAPAGESRVRLFGPRRKVIPGFDNPTVNPSPATACRTKSTGGTSPSNRWRAKSSGWSFC
jgi:hypothetical protein